MLYLHLCCASISRMCPKVSEKPKTAHKGVMLSEKLDIIVSTIMNEIKTLHVLNFGSGNPETFFHINE